MHKRFIRSFYSDHRRCLQFPIIHDVLWQTTVNYKILRIVVLTTVYFNVIQCCAHTLAAIP